MSQTEREACQSPEDLGGKSFPFLTSSSAQMKHVQIYRHPQVNALLLKGG